MTQNLNQDLSKCLPSYAVNIRRLLDRQLALWPDHLNFLTRSFAERSPETMAMSELTATQIVELAGDRIDRYCVGYKWMCDAVIQEEIYFRRYGKYQATSFEDVFQRVYSNPEAMTHYMDGLLLSQVFWRNHADVSVFYKRYLDSLPARFSHLEIGPGHGLLLAHAVAMKNCGSATAWDVSDASLQSTRHCLEKMKVTKPVNLEKRNIFDLGAVDLKFDSVVVSEVLEHLENPRAALDGIRSVIAADGRAFINIPCNSPAPDHLYLYSSPDDFFGMLEDAGLKIEQRLVTPATGATLEKALKHKMAISCAAVVGLNA